MSNLGQCLTTPASAEMDASVQFFPLWLQFGPDLSSVLGDTALDVGVGPGIGLGFEAPYNGQPVWDICAAVTAEAEVKIPNPTDPTNEDADLLNDTLSSALLGPYSIISSNNDDAVNLCPFPASPPNPLPARPGAPTNVTATPGNGQATVIWSPPPTNEGGDGGGDITDYIIIPISPAGSQPSSAV